ncbi:ribbon-helix-helix protein, CopG family [Thermofilum pendens]|uniref:Ribbon-helix-helix protein CopG domain-containing protein n=1 Tax=Thermofilum pendens (strain DSM 2475 / Hrk 5) TaxID=368408 RepID=A1S0T9_THEPD|nr:ribbon-helix-helix protein, CopG family [Thermofilum pendens]ABL79069.1 hypothetical protein Tpen_1674 [Thermofilum pendens Hrk 5]
MKTIAVDEATWKRLRELKDKLGFQSYNDVIRALVEQWHVSRVQESVEKLEIDVDAAEALAFFRQMKSIQKTKA